MGLIYFFEHDLLTTNIGEATCAHLIIQFIRMSETNLKISQFGKY